MNLWILRRFNIIIRTPWSDDDFFKIILCLQFNGLFELTREIKKKLNAAKLECKIRKCQLHTLTRIRIRIHNSHFHNFYIFKLFCENIHLERVEFYCFEQLLYV